MLMLMESESEGKSKVFKQTEKQPLLENEKDDISLTQKVELITFLTMTILNFVLAFVFQHHLVVYSSAKELCGDFWNALLMSCIVHWITTVIIGFSFVHAVYTYRINKGYTFTLFNWLVSVWVLFCFYTASSSCVEDFKKEYPALYADIITEIVFFCVFSTIITFICVFGCIKKYAKNEEIKEMENIV
jgi:hypothetical protein